MVAAPQYGTITVQTGGGNLSVDVYLSDVANGAGNFDSGVTAGASSETFWKSPVNGLIVDFSVKTGLTDTTAGRVTINGAPTKSVVRWANHVNTLNNRPALNIPINAGENLGIIQLA
jgi:hypothetical protein